MHEFPEPDWYLDHVLINAEPGPPPRVVHGPVDEWRAWWAGIVDQDGPLVRAAATQGFVLTTPQLAEFGITRSRARNEVRQRRWTDAGHGAFAPVDIRDADDGGAGRGRERRRRHAVRCSAAALRRPRAAVTGRSGAIIHGLPTFGVPATPEMTERDVGQGRRASIHLYAARLPNAEISDWYGIPVEAPARTLVSLARHGRRDAIMAADAALRECVVDRTAIARALETAVGWPWVRQARAVLALADPLAESPLESITRLALLDAGFPDPSLQVTFGVDRVDFYWPKYGVVLEADGALKYVGDASLREKRRERRLLRLPEVRCVERVGWSDVIDDWPQTAADLRRWFR